MVKLLANLPGERRRVQLKPWLYRVAHNESVEILRKRRPVDPIEPEELSGDPGPEASAETRERLRGLISDLRELPDRQRGALVMRELGGLSFEQIGAALETSAASARQMLYEARLGLQEMQRGRAMGCDEVRRKLSDGDRRVFRRRDVRAHLRHCPACRDFEAAIGGRRHDLAAIAPLPALAAAALLKGALGGGFASVGGAAAAGGVGGSVGGAGSAGGVAGTGLGGIAGTTAVKAVAVVAVAGAIGAGAADRADLIRVFPGHGGAGSATPDGPRPDARPTAAPGGTDAAVDAAGPAGGSGPESAPRRARAVQTGGNAASTRAAPAAGAATPASTEAGSDSEHGIAAPGRGSHANSAGKAHPAHPAKGGGSANAHGANPHAHRGTHSNQGGGKAKATAPAHPIPAEPKSAPQHAKPSAEPHGRAEGPGALPEEAAEAGGESSGTP